MTLERSHPTAAGATIRRCTGAGAVNMIVARPTPAPEVALPSWKVVSLAWLRAGIQTAPWVAPHPHGVPA